MVKHQFSEKTSLLNVNFLINYSVIYLVFLIVFFMYKREYFIIRINKYG